MIREFLDSKIGEKKSIGIAGLKTLAIVSQSVSRENTVASYTVEDGATLSDHITTQGVRLSISASVGTKWKDISKSFEIEAKLNSAVGLTNQYLPIKSNAQLQKLEKLKSKATNLVNKVDGAITNIKSLADKFSDNEDNNQKVVIGFLNGLFKSKQLIEIECGLEVHKNMVIVALAYSIEPSGNITLGIEAQEIKLAKVKTVSLAKAPKQMQSLIAQASEKAKVKPDKVANESILFNLTK